MERRQFTLPFWLVRDAFVAAVGIALMIFARPSRPEPAAVDMPAWHLQLRSVGHRANRVLLYGKQSGFHIVRLPAADDFFDDRSVIPPTLVDREVWLVALGEKRFHLRGNPGNSDEMSFSGNGRVMKVYRNERATGIRVW